MISDTISDALDEIEQYEAEHPEAYAEPDVQRLLTEAKAAMRALLARLDAASQSGTGER